MSLLVHELWRFREDRSFVYRYFARINQMFKKKKKIDLRLEVQYMFCIPWLCPIPGPWIIKMQVPPYSRRGSQFLNYFSLW